MLQGVPGEAGLVRKHKSVGEVERPFERITVWLEAGFTSGKIWVQIYIMHIMATQVWLMP